MEQVSGIDYSQYASWPTISAPTGAVYYKVPGTGYVYDPFLSQQKGRPVLWTNPQPQLDEKQRIEKLQKQAASPMGQIAPVAGTVAGVVGANYAIDALGPKAVEEGAKAGLGSGVSSGANSAAQAFQQGAAAQDAAQASFNAGALNYGSNTGTVVPAGAPIVDGVENAASAAQPGMFSVGSTGGNLLGGAGVALGAYGAYQGIKSGNPLTAGAGGLGVGMGLSQLGYALGPPGWAAAIAIPVIASLAGKLGDKDMWKTEGNRLQKLQKNGVFVPPGLIEGLPQSHGRSKEELVQIAQQTGGNVKFASSRDEKDLTGADLVGFSTFAERDPEWFKRPRDQQVSYAQQLLDKGLVREHHGTIDVNWAKADPAPWEAKQETAAAPKKLSARDVELWNQRNNSMGKELAKRSDARNKK